MRIKIVKGIRRSEYCCFAVYFNLNFRSAVNITLNLNLLVEITTLVGDLSYLVYALHSLKAIKSIMSSSFGHCISKEGKEESQSIHVHNQF